MRGDASLTRRPMGRVAAPLRQMGATIEGRSDPARPGDVYPPLRVRGGALVGIEHQLKVASAQLKSALILAALQAHGRTVLREPARSRDHTERMLGFLGAPITTAPSGEIVVDPTGWNGRLKATALTIPGDLSSATFLIVAALVVPGSDVVVENVGLNPTRAGALDVLRAMGADLTIEPVAEAMGEPVGRVRARASSLRGTRVDGELALRAIDEIPALAVAAASAEGETTFADLAELRIKESDRIAALARELGRAGARVEEHPDGFVVEGLAGRPPAGGAVVPEHDHRIAMAGAILGLTGDRRDDRPHGRHRHVVPDLRRDAHRARRLHRTSLSRVVGQSAPGTSPAAQTRAAEHFARASTARRVRLQSVVEPMASRQMVSCRLDRSAPRRPRSATGWSTGDSTVALAVRQRREPTAQVRSGCTSGSSCSWPWWPGSAPT